MSLIDELMNAYRNNGGKAANAIYGENVTLANSTLSDNFNAIVEATAKKGSALSKDDYKKLVGGSTGYESYDYDRYLEWYSQNQDAISSIDYNALQANSAVGALRGAMQSQGMAVSVGDAGYNSYLDALNASSDTAYNTQEDLMAAELEREESNMLRAVGLAQRQNERDIAKRRQQALKSGMSTAQLAAQEQQNLLASQTAATQLAQQYQDKRFDTINQYAQQRAQQYNTNTQAALQNVMSNQQALMSAYAGNYQADAYNKQQP